jgi:hypothetical protein
MTALALAATLALSACDFAAKNLAKQIVEAAKQMAELQDKAGDIEDKTAALSDRDRRTYQAELERLGVEGALLWLYSDEAALLTGAPEETGDERGGILGLLGGLFGGGGSSSGVGVNAPTSRGTSAWNGTWVNDDESDIEGSFTFRNGNWEIILAEGGPALGGTITTSGNNFSFAIGKIHGGYSMWSASLRPFGVNLESKWYTKNQFRTALNKGGPFPVSVDSLLDEFFTTYMTGTYSISGNKLTMSENGGKTHTLTKIR